MTPRPFIVYEPFLVEYSRLSVQMVLGGQTVDVPAPSRVAPFDGQKLCDSHSGLVADKYGPTKTAPLGYRVHARSGDKGSNANVGFWALEDDEYEWLRSLLSVGSFKKLLADDYKDSYVIERFEMPNIRCVHFLVKGILEGGISSSYRLDGLAKSFGEFLRRWPSYLVYFYFTLFLFLFSSPPSYAKGLLANRVFIRCKTCRDSYKISRKRHNLKSAIA